MTPPLLILAGGQATRLGSTTEPKFLVPIDNEHRFADIQLKWAAQKGFNHIALSVGKGADQIKSYCGTGEKWGLKISYFEDGKVLRGTGGATYQILKELFQVNPFVALTYGDTILPFHPSSALQSFKDEPSTLALMTVFSHPPEMHQPNAEWIQKPFLNYDKKNPGKDWQFLDYGFLAFKPGALKYFPDKEIFDLAEPLQKISSDKKLFGFEAKKIFQELGNLESLEDFRSQWKKGEILYE